MSATLEALTPEDAETVITLACTAREPYEAGMWHGGPALADILETLQWNAEGKSKEMEKLQERIDELEAEVATLEQDLSTADSRVDELENRLKELGDTAP